MQSIYLLHKFEQPIATSFPGSLFSASIVVEKTTMEAEKRDPGNEVEPIVERQLGATKSIKAIASL